MTKKDLSKINEALSSQHCAIVGKTGAGKSWAAKTVIEALLDIGRRVCIIDPTGVHWGLRSSANGKQPGFSIAIFGGEHGDVPINKGSGDALAKIIAENNLPAIIDVSEMMIGERHTFATDFFAELYRLNRKPLHLIIDEADEFSPQNPMPEMRRLSHQVDRIVRRGRSRGFRVMMITQRPAVLHKNVLTQANSLVAMRMTAPQDRKAIEEWIKGNGDINDGKQVLNSLARLERGTGWIWSPENDLFLQQPFPKIRTFDSGKAPEDGDIALPSKISAVDLAGIKEAFSAAEAEANDNNPVMLHKQIAMLKMELANKAAMVVRREDLEKHLIMAHQEGAEEGRNEGYQEAMQAIDRILNIQYHFNNMDQLRLELMAVERKIGEAAPSIDKKTAGGKMASLAKVIKQSRSPDRQAVITDSDLISGPMQRILDAIAWMESIGVNEPEQTAVAFLAGYTIGGGAFNNPRGALRTAGLIEYRNGNIALTAAGRGAAARVDVPLSNGALHGKIKERLPGPEWKILQVLLTVYPKYINNEDLARSAGYEPGGGAFNNPRGRLKSLGLIEYPERGRVRARDILFPLGGMAK